MCCARSSKKKRPPMLRPVPPPSRRLPRGPLWPSQRRPQRRQFRSSRQPRPSRQWNRPHRNSSRPRRWRRLGHPQPLSPLPKPPWQHRRRRVRAQFHQPLPCRRVPRLPFRRSPAFRSRRHPFKPRNHRPPLRPSRPPRLRQSRVSSCRKPAHAPCTRLRRRRLEPMRVQLRDARNRENRSSSVLVRRRPDLVPRCARASAVPCIPRANRRPVLVRWGLDREHCRPGRRVRAAVRELRRAVRVSATFREA